MIAWIFGPRKDATVADTIALEIAERFKTGDVRSDLNSFGISEMSVIYKGKRIAVTWYSDGPSRSLSIGGDRSFPTDASDCIFKAARRRAQLITDERLAALESSHE